MGLFRKKTAEEIEARQAEKEANRERYKRIFNNNRERWVGPKPEPRGEVELVKFTLPTSSAHMFVKHKYSMGRSPVVVTGTVANGVFYVGDTIYVWDGFSAVDKTVVTEIRQMKQSFDSAPTGAMVQIVLDARNVNVRKGDILFKEA